MVTHEFERATARTRFTNRPNNMRLDCLCVAKLADVVNLVERVVKRGPANVEEHTHAARSAGSKSSKRGFQRKHPKPLKKP
jgi:hypothetical protein